MCLRRGWHGLPRVSWSLPQPAIHYWTILTTREGPEHATAGDIRADRIRYCRLIQEYSQLRPGNTEGTSIERL